MLSSLRKGFVYNNISSDIVEHDLDIDADQWCYDGRDVYRGSIDLDYSSKEFNVYWLYDDDSKRIGLAEHDAYNPAVFKSLWFRENPYATLYQDEKWKSTGKTLWSKLSNEAYQDCLEDDFKSVFNRALNSGVLLMTPELLTKKPEIQHCETCGKKFLINESSCSHVSGFIAYNQFSILFLDDNFVIYERDSEITLQSDASSEVLQEGQK